MSHIAAGASFVGLMLRPAGKGWCMGFWARLRGTERSSAVQQAINELERQMSGWRVIDFRHRMFCRRPVKLYAYGATAEGPGGRRVLAVSADEDQGVSAVRGLADAVKGWAEPSSRWAPPLIAPRQKNRPPWPLADPESGEEAAARDRALAMLPAGVSPMNVDTERFADIRVSAVVVQMPDGLGTAGVGLSRAEAWEALAERLRGDLPESGVWYPVLNPERRRAGS
jgi:hypothetical protein